MDGQVNASNVDPSGLQLANQVNFAQKLRLVYNVDTEELVYSSMESFQYGKMLSFDEIERVIGTGLAASRKIHKLFLQSSQAE